MNGIKMSDCKFYADKEKRTVVCVIPKTKAMLLDFIEDNFSFNDVDLYAAINGFWADNNSLYKQLMLPPSFTGKAICAAEDEWNEELGRKIAFSRAKDKCYKSFFKRANMFIQAIDRRLGDAIADFNDFGVKLENKREILQNQIEAEITPAKEE